MSPTNSILRLLPLPTILSILLILAATLGFSATATAAAPAVYNVRDFGALGDGTTKDTAAFQRALDTCAVSGGGEVLVPSGRYLIGSVQMGTRTILRFASADSVLIGSPDADDYPMVDVRWEGRWQPGRRALIYADNADHIAIIGPGRIEGNREVAKPQNPRGVVILEPINCHDVRWEGFTVTQGGNWATHPTYCTDVVIKNLTIRGDRDGIDIDSCKNVLIEGCDIDTGDDAISLKSGRGLDGARIAKPAEDIVIRNCKLRCRHFASIGIGSETSAGVRNVRIENCSFDSNTHAIYIKTRIGRAGTTENISAENLEILNGGFLRINLTVGGNTNTADDPVPGLLGFPSAKNLSFTNVRLHNATTIVDGTQVTPEKPVENLTLANITGTAAKGMSLVHMTSVTLKDIAVTVANGPLLATRNVTGTGLENAVPLVTRTTLFNGKDLTGWKLFLAPPAEGTAPVDPKSTWSVTDGILRFDTKTFGYIKTDRAYGHYKLHLEWRWPTGSSENANSGLLLHTHGPDKIWPLCYEAQLKTGNAGQFIGLGLDIPDAPLTNNRKRSPRLADSSEKPHGEWNSYDITCRGDAIEVFVNGIRQNAATKLPVVAGAIALQMEGSPIEFRNLWLEEL